jgi:hypothetical protein
MLSICLCTDCHTTTHFGLASVNGKSTEAFKHLCIITGLPADQVSQHIDVAFALWRSRSAIAWELDLSILIKAGITVTKAPSAAERADLPGKILRRI